MAENAAGRNIPIWWISAFWSLSAQLHLSPFWSLQPADFLPSTCPFLDLGGYWTLAISLCSIGPSSWGCIYTTDSLDFLPREPKSSLTDGSNWRLADKLMSGIYFWPSAAKFGH